MRSWKIQKVALETKAVEKVTKQAVAMPEGKTVVRIRPKNLSPESRTRSIPKHHAMALPQQIHPCLHCSCSSLAHLVEAELLSALPWIFRLSS